MKLARGLAFGFGGFFVSKIVKRVLDTPLVESLWDRD